MWFTPVLLCGGRTRAVGPDDGLSVRILTSLSVFFRPRQPASHISRNNILLSSVWSISVYVFLMEKMCFVFPSNTLCKFTKPYFSMGAIVFTSDLLWQYSVFTAHMLCSCWCHTLKPCKSLWCWCWEWNYGKNVQWCAWADCTWLFVLVVVWGCLIVALWFWKNTELLDWWNIPEIQHLRALNSLHMSPVSTV